MMKELVFITNNRHKLREVQQLVGERFKLLTLADAGFEGDIPEPFPTVRENAIAKVEFFGALKDADCFAEDTGLETDVLNGEPGAFSARYAGTSDPEDNINLLLSRLDGNKNRTARFRTVIALSIDKELHIFEGVTEGTITSERKGSSGFGYDPVFLPAGSHQTFAEMKPEEKNLISHRAKAIKKMLNYLQSLKDSL